MAHNFMSDRVETWFPENNSRNPHDVGGVRFKWGRTTRELIEAKKRAGLGSVDDPYSVERQKELWSENAVNDVLQKERLGDPKQAQHEAEVKWCARNGIKADAIHELRELYYSSRGGKLTEEQLHSVPESMMLPPDERSKKALRKALMGSHAQPAGGGTDIPQAAAKAIAGDDADGEKLTARMHLKLASGPREGGRRPRVKWQDWYYVLDGGWLRSYPSNWPCDETSLHHEIELSRLTGVTSPRWLDDESEVHMQLDTALKKKGKRGGEGTEVVLRARTEATALLWANTLKEHAARANATREANGGAGDKDAHAGLKRPKSPLKGREKMIAWLPPEPMSEAEIRAVRGPSARQLGGTGKTRLRAGTAHGTVALATFMAAVLYGVALGANGWTRVQLRNATVTAGLWAIGCQTHPDVPASCYAEEDYAYDSDTNATFNGPSASPLMVETMRHTFLDQSLRCSMPQRTDMEIGRSSRGTETAAAADARHALAAAGCDTLWRAAQVSAALGEFVLLCVGHRLLRAGREPERIVLLLGSLHAVSAILGLVPVVTWVTALDYRVWTAYHPVPGIVAAQLGDAFWCCVGAVVVCTCAAGLCFWQIRDASFHQPNAVHAADEVLSALPANHFAKESKWILPKRHANDSEEEEEVITFS